MPHILVTGGIWEGRLAVGAGISTVHVIQQQMLICMATEELLRGFPTLMCMVTEGVFRGTTMDRLMVTIWEHTHRCITRRHTCHRESICVPRTCIIKALTRMACP